MRSTCSAICGTPLLCCAIIEWAYPRVSGREDNGTRSNFVFWTPDLHGQHSWRIEESATPLEGHALGVALEPWYGRGRQQRGRYFVQPSGSASGPMRLWA